MSGLLLLRQIAGAPLVGTGVSQGVQMRVCEVWRWGKGGGEGCGRTKVGGDEGEL